MAGCRNHGLPAIDRATYLIDGEAVLQGARPKVGGAGYVEEVLEVTRAT